MKDICKIRDYRIIIPKEATMNERRAARFLQEQIKLICGKTVPVLPDSTAPVDLEIAVGRTSRENADGLFSDRSPEGLWEYRIRKVGKRAYLSGMGLPEAGDQPYTSAYKLINDGAYGTVFAAYRFAEDVLNSPFLFSAYEEYPETPGLAMPDELNIDYTKEALRAEKPAKIEGAAMWSVQSSELLNWNMGCTILRTAGGKLIVVDGGHEADAEHILSVLESIAAPEKPVIEAWIFTHLHEDHYGVYKRICLEPTLAARITVKHFYCHLLPEEFYTKLSKEANPAQALNRNVLLQSGESLGAEVHTVEVGDEIVVDEMRFRVLHVPQMEYATKMNMNDSSVVYRLDYDGKQRILFLGDAEWVCSNDLLEHHADELPSDVVMVGHHGCGNVSLPCYEKIGAKVAIWQIGNRFWYSDNGEGLNTHNTGVIRTRAWLCELGIKRENFLRDTNRILSLPLPVPMK